MGIIDDTARLFKRFPGIGERQARRFVLFLLSVDESYREKLIEGINELSRKVKRCPLCFRFSESLNDGVCERCAETKEPDTLLVVEKDADADAIFKSGTFHGYYFIMGGLVPIAEKKVVGETRTDLLIKRVAELLKKGSLREVILAFSLTPDGMYTDQYVREQLQKITNAENLSITTLGRGLSTGTELEYSDTDTIKSALLHRKVD